MRKALEKPSVQQPASDPSNADLMAKLDSMMGSMALKEDIVVAQMETVKELRAEFEPVKQQAAAALQQTDHLRERIDVVENTSATERKH